MTRPTLLRVEQYYDRLCKREGFQLFGKNGGL